MVLKTIAGAQEKNGDTYAIGVMASHAEGLSTGYKGYQELKADYAPVGMGAKARVQNTLG